MTSRNDKKILYFSSVRELYGTNCAPQGLTSDCASEKRASSFFARLVLKFHETEDYTIYPAPILNVTRRRFTKHYFIGDRCVVSKIGAGKFQNAYGHGANVVTAGRGSMGSSSGMASSSVESSVNRSISRTSSSENNSGSFGSGSKSSSQDYNR